MTTFLWFVKRLHYFLQKEAVSLKGKLGSSYKNGCKLKKQCKFHLKAPENQIFRTFLFTCPHASMNLGYILKTCYEIVFLSELKIAEKVNSIKPRDLWTLCFCIWSFLTLSLPWVDISALHGVKIVLRPTLT